jgi:hypothetical protein
MNSLPSSGVILGTAFAIGLLIVLALRVLRAIWTTIQLRRTRGERRRVPAENLDDVAAFHDAVISEAPTDVVDDRTWSDLNLADVFTSLDYTESEPGRQYLYHLLRTPQSQQESLARMERGIRAFSADDSIREEVRSVLRLLSDPRAARIVHLIFGAIPPRPRLWRAIPCLSASAMVCIGLCAIWPIAAFVLLGVCVVNIGVIVWLKPRIRAVAPAVHQLPMMLRVAKAIGRLELNEFAHEKETLRRGANSLQQLHLAARWLMLEDGQASGGRAFFGEFLNLLFLFDVIAFMRAATIIPRCRELLRAMFESIGWIDAAQSIAAWRANLATWAVPEFSEAAKSLSVQDLRHPLLSAPVANSLSIANAGVLITGSNMSGKTTFVRALGVNAVLAQTLHTVCARAWRAPMLRVSTSIGQSDNILQGKSYYLAEVETALEMVRSKETGKQHLFLLDELFRGTNTTERVAAAYALLSYLNRGNDLVVVATHDIELLGLLGASFESHHFRETIADGALTFDFRIRAGPSSTRNAIALLEVMQFPMDLVRDALSMTDWPSRKPDRD